MTGVMDIRRGRVKLKKELMEDPYSHVKSLKLFLKEKKSRNQQPHQKVLNRRLIKLCHLLLVIFLVAFGE